MLFCHDLLWYALRVYVLGSRETMGMLCCFARACQGRRLGYSALRCAEGFAQPQAFALGPGHGSFSVEHCKVRCHEWSTTAFIVVALVVAPPGPIYPIP